PIGRGACLLGKALVLGASVLAAWLLLAISALGLSALLSDFGDASEILPTGRRYVLIEARELWPELPPALRLPLLPLLALVALGSLSGALARTGAAALALALAALLLIDLSRALVRGSALEAWVPWTHLPSPLGDSSAVARFLEMARGISDPLA